MKIYSRYDPPKDDGITFKKPSLTQQCIKEQCDINNILESYSQQARAMRANIADLLPPIDSQDFADISNMEDFLTAQNKIAKVTQIFEQMPSNVRREFGDDPSNFIAALGDSQKYSKLADLGVFSKQEYARYEQALQQFGQSGMVAGNNQSAESDSVVSGTEQKGQVNQAAQ